MRDRGWRGAIDLKAGDVLVFQNGGYIIVEKTQNEILETPVTVYNFEVEDFHTYYVGTDSALAHNVCMKSQEKKINPAKFEADYNLSRNTFHRDIKPKIIGKVEPNYQVGKNPNILMDRSGNIAYQGVKGKGFQDTGLNTIDIFIL